MDKTLTIIVPAYNMEKYLDRCLSSLIINEVLMPQLEVVVINDGSKDNTSGIAHSYEQRFPNTFRVIDKENGNYGSCINRGLKEASGTFIKVLDADDQYNTAELFNFINFLGNVPFEADCILNGVRYIDDDGHLFGEKLYNDEPSLFQANDLQVDSIKCLSIHALTYRRSIFEKHPYKQTEGISYTDLEWSFYPLLWLRSISVFPGIIYIYTAQRDGQTVAPATHCKNMWMEMSIVSKITNYMVSVRENKNISLAETRLYFYCEALYFYYLIKYPKSLKTDDLFPLDNLLKKIPQIYSRLDLAVYNLRFIGSFHYIKKWRAKRSRSSLCFIFSDLLELLSSLKRK